MTDNDPKQYCLHQDHDELARLDLQGVLYHDITRRALVDGGITAGMRVLDLGCGTGSVSRLAAELVGPDGQVVGLDRNAETVEAARRRSTELAVPNVRFVHTDIATYSDRDPFDAVIGRFVLMHQADPVTTIRFATQLLRDNGIWVLVETHTSLLPCGGHSVPFSPLFDRMVQWKASVVTASGADPEAGPHLYRHLKEAGLSDIRLRLEAPMAAGEDTPAYRYMVDSMDSLQPAAQRHGIGPFDEATTDDRLSRLRREINGPDGVIILWPVVVASATKVAG